MCNFLVAHLSFCLSFYLLVVKNEQVTYLLYWSCWCWFFSIVIVLSLFLCRSCAVFTPVRSSAVQVTWWLWCSMAQSRAKIPGTLSSMSMFTTAWKNQVKLGLSTQFFITQPFLTHFYKTNTQMFLHHCVKVELCFPFLISLRCQACAGSGCTAGIKGSSARGRDHGQRGDGARRSLVVLRQPLQRHQASAVTQAAHDFHLQRWTTRWRQRQGSTGSYQSQWPQGDWCVNNRLIAVSLDWCVTFKCSLVFYLNLLAKRFLSKVCVRANLMSLCFSRSRHWSNASDETRWLWRLLLLSGHCKSSWGWARPGPAAGALQQTGRPLEASAGQGPQEESHGPVPLTASLDKWLIFLWFINHFVPPYWCLTMNASPSPLCLLCRRSSSSTQH